MPVYNASSYLEKTLESVHQQTYTTWQLIIVDDGSVDNSYGIAQNFKSIHPEKVIILQSNTPRSGAASCRNKGLQEAEGEFVIFLDADDVLESFCLEQRAKFMQNNQKVDWAVFNQYAWNVANNPPYPLYNRQVNSVREAIMCFMQMNPAWQTMAVIWKRKAIKQLNGFDDTLYYMEDPDLHLRALLFKNFNCAFAFNYPADSYYRLPILTAENSNNFYDNSIKSRFQFIKKILELLTNLDNNLINETRKNIRIGFFVFLRKMLLARLNLYSKEFKSIVYLLKEKSILSSADIIKLKVLYTVFINDNLLIKGLKLRGIALRLLFIP